MWPQSPALFFSVSTDQLFDLHLLEYDACRILAETCRARGEYDLAKLALEADEAGPDRGQIFYERYGRGILERIRSRPGQIPQPCA